MLIKLSQMDKNNKYYIYGGSKKDIEDLKNKYSSKTYIFKTISLILKSKKTRKCRHMCITLY